MADARSNIEEPDYDYISFENDAFDEEAEFGKNQSPTPKGDEKIYTSVCIVAIITLFIMALLIVRLLHLFQANEIIYDQIDQGTYKIYTNIQFCMFIVFFIINVAVWD
jgi:hypothetical protein